MRLGVVIVFALMTGCGSEPGLCVHGMKLVDAGNYLVAMTENGKKQECK